MSVRSGVRRRIEPSSLTAVLAAGDVAMIASFCVVGAMQGHDISSARMIAETLTTFLVGWGVVSVAGGLYTADAVGSVRRAVFWTVPAWAVAVVLALALRATPVFHGNAVFTFALVAFGVGGALVTGWRTLVAVVVGR